MNSNTVPRQSPALSAGLAVVALCATVTVLATPLLGHLDLTNIALVYVLVVTVAALVVLGEPVRAVTRLRRRPVAEFARVDRWDGPAFGG